MANLEGFKEKYIVLKHEDVSNYISEEGQVDLIQISDIINICRERDGKKVNKYLVINVDEPYADEVIEIMKRNGHWG